MQAKKKILAITCEMGRPAQATAAWDGQNLFIMEITEAGVDPYSWLHNAQVDIEKKSAAGWVVMVGDRTGSYPPPATAWNMNGMSESGKTNLQSAMEMYFALQSRGTLIFEPHLKKYQIHLGGENDMAYMENDDRGRSVYRINWTNFRDAHLALLMCVAGAAMEEPLSERWIKTFAGKLPELKKPNIWPVISTMKNYWASEQQKIKKAREEMEARKSVQH